MITAYIDGGARGNPGPAGYGVQIQGSDGTVLDEPHGAIGLATINQDADRPSNLGMDETERRLRAKK